MHDVSLPNGAISASFAYDGDGHRVKSTIGTTTTFFVGTTYESTGGLATKYYYVAGQRLAMRVGQADPYYLLTDHLGSTTVTTDASGTPVSELRYKPWRSGDPEEGRSYVQRSAPRPRATRGIDPPH